MGNLEGTVELRQKFPRSSPQSGGGVADVSAVGRNAQLLLQRGHDLLRQLLPAEPSRHGTAEHIHFQCMRPAGIVTAEINRHIVSNGHISQPSDLPGTAVIALP